MDKEILINNISQLTDETLDCVKEIEKISILFPFDVEVQEDLEQFLRIVKLKAMRVANPRDKKDINNNIRRNHVYEKWQTTKIYNTISDN